jgi:hypothetical protein
MRKVLLVVLVAILPAMAFADLQLGGVAMYTGDPTVATTVSVSDFTFGAETRLKLGLLQGGASLLYYPSAGYASIAALTDIGVSVDLLLFRLGAGIGPNIAFNIGDGAPTPVSAGLNLKLSGDVNLGDISLGLVGYYYVSDFAQLANVGTIFSKLPWLGVTAMFKLF